MDITPLISKGRQIISRYGSGGFVINEVRAEGNILLLGDQLLPWIAAGITGITPESLQPFFDAAPKPEIVLIGSGSRFIPLAPELRALFQGHHINADAMDTGAACRTYNVLITEGRQVAAALIAV